MSTTTIAHLTEQTGVTVTSDWADDIEIPVLTGIQRQGDVLIVPAARQSATTATPSAGVPVVRGESGGNTHAIHADGDVKVDVKSASTSDLVVAVVTVATGSVAWLAHPEHGFLGIGEGTYEVRRQREMADEMRVVSD